MENPDRCILKNDITKLYYYYHHIRITVININKDEYSTDSSEPNWSVPTSNCNENDIRSSQEPMMIKVISHWLLTD